MKISEYIKLMVEKTGKEKLYKKRLLNILILLTEAKLDLQLTEFDYFNTEQFVIYLKKQNYKQNTVYSHFQTLRHILNRAAREHSVNPGYLDVKVYREETAAVYLTPQEIERIRLLEGLSPKAQITRDYFILMCYTGLRISDVRKLTTQNLIEDKIVIRTVKTRKVVEIPVAPAVKIILDNWNNQFPKCTSQQGFYQTLRRICMLAGINDNILVTCSKDGKIINIIKKKYEIVTAHTGRRSFATNLYLASMHYYIPIWRIMMLTGHRSQNTFFQYIRISRDENVKTLQKHPFFNDLHYYNKLIANNQYSNTDLY